MNNKTSVIHLCYYRSLSSCKFAVCNYCSHSTSFITNCVYPAGRCLYTRLRKSIYAADCMTHAPTGNCWK